MRIVMCAFSIHMGRDGVHYSAKGQVEAGYMFADAMLKLVKKKTVKKSAEKPKP